MSEHKRKLIANIVRERTRHITLVFEDIDKPHNISAVLRTAECMGIQDLHFIKNRNDYNVNPDITQGAAKWLTLHHHNQHQEGAANVREAVDCLRKNGYQIMATSLDESARSVNDIGTKRKTAIVFGTEISGISHEVAGNVDGLVRIPMKGFTESFNLSVSAAIILTVLMQNQSGDWSLTEQEQEELVAEWYKKVVREAERILARENRPK